ncbi:MAG: CDP-glycerol glycerophosphotransferase family protein [Deltaproteobacteria bacterium]|nr:CDP-glycerol glycerophosphotransferase family protein [Deltaproteobacteria bacterium]MBN2671968.1 CDP-glycerol glycerophosphotransferase family protein [Deltaproteobacteria bacterium]
MLFSRAKRKKSRLWLTGILDSVTPKIDDSIVLVAKRTYGYSGNLRVVGDYLSKHSTKKIYLFFEGTLSDSLRAHLTENRVTHLSTFDSKTMKCLLAAQTLIVDHSIRDCYIHSKRAGRKVVNLWHGVPIKRIEMAIPGIEKAHLDTIEQNAKIYDMMIASSRVDQLAISSTFHVPYYKVLPSGLPRYDLFFADLSEYVDLAEQQKNIDSAKSGKKLVLYAPTFRQHHPSPCEQNQHALRKLAAELEPLGFQLGIRTHQYDNSAAIFEDDKNIVMYTGPKFAETNVVLRNTDILITDFSSLWVDYLFMNKPILGFATDLDAYKNEERNFLYDLDDIFPGPFHKTDEALIADLISMIKEQRFTVDHAYQKKLLLPPEENIPNITQQVCSAILE